ncbi:MAG: OsmC family protein, partial [Demequinaceae bacterium]|nr:OsmC family protein [Demequinaceae bacterium]
GKDTDGRAGYSAITVKIEVEGDADQAKLDQIIAIAETRCPVSDNLSHVTPIAIEIIKKG